MSTSRPRSAIFPRTAGRSCQMQGGHEIPSGSGWGGGEDTRIGEEMEMSDEEEIEEPKGEWECIVISDSDEEPMGDAPAEVEEKIDSRKDLESLRDEEGIDVDGEPLSEEQVALYALSPPRTRSEPPSSHSSPPMVKPESVETAEKVFEDPLIAGEDGATRSSGGEIAMDDQAIESIAALGPSSTPLDLVTQPSEIPPSHLTPPSPPLESPTVASISHASDSEASQRRSHHSGTLVDDDAPSDMDCEDSTEGLSQTVAPSEFGGGSEMDCGMSSDEDEVSGEVLAEKRDEEGNGASSNGDSGYGEDRKLEEERRASSRDDTNPSAPFPALATLSTTFATPLPDISLDDKRGILDAALDNAVRKVASNVESRISSTPAGSPPLEMYDRLVEASEDDKGLQVLSDSAFPIRALPLSLHQNSSTSHPNFSTAPPLPGNRELRREGGDIPILDLASPSSDQELVEGGDVPAASEIDELETDHPGTELEDQLDDELVDFPLPLDGSHVAATDELSDDDLEVLLAIKVDTAAPADRPSPFFDELETTPIDEVGPNLDADVDSGLRDLPSPTNEIVAARTSSTSRLNFLFAQFDHCRPKEEEDFPALQGRLESPARARSEGEGFVREAEVMGTAGDELLPSSSTGAVAGPATQSTTLAREDLEPNSVVASSAAQGEEVPRVPKAGDRFGTLESFRTACRESSLASLGINMSINDSSNSSTRRMRCSMRNRLGADGKNCTFLIVAEPEDEGWVVDSQRSRFEHNHGPDARFVANPRWRPNSAVIKQTKEANLDSPSLSALDDEPSRAVLPSRSRKKRPASPTPLDPPPPPPPPKPYPPTLLPRSKASNPVYPFGKKHVYPPPPMSKVAPPTQADRAEYSKLGRRTREASVESSRSERSEREKPKKQSERGSRATRDEQWEEW